MRKLRAAIGRHPLLTLNLAALVCAAAFWAGANRWYNFPPKRPAGVSAKAVYIHGLPLGLPGPKHGVWVNCWYEAPRSVDVCQVDDVRGNTNYRGVFLPYQGARAVPQSGLVVDAKATSARGPHFVDLATTAVPLLYLRDGEVLIPAEAYQQGKALLERDVWEKTGRSPKRPTGVSADAVYVPWALEDAYGMWLDCWLDVNRKVDVCRATATDGRLYSEGTYLPDTGPAPLPDAALGIDPEATWVNKLDSSVIVPRAEASSPTPPQPLPFIYLRNGAILVPTSHYQSERKWLEKWKAMQPELKRGEREWEHSRWW